MKIKHVVVLLLTCILNCRIEYGATKYILLKIQLHSLGAHSVESSSQPLQKHEIEGRHSKVGAGSKSKQFGERLCIFHINFIYIYLI